MNYISSNFRIITFRKNELHMLVKVIHGVIVQGEMDYQSFLLFPLTFTTTFLLVFFSASSTFAIPTDQTTVVFTTWKIPTEGVTDIEASFNGDIYFTMYNDNKIARLIPLTNTITEWTVPTNNSGPLDLTLDSFSGSVYFTEHKGNKIGRLIPSTNTITEWTVPD